MVKDEPDTPVAPKTYLVEYDLPSDSRRFRFYRAIKRYLRLYYMDEEGWSTGSVVVTDSRKYAFYVYHEARRIGGTANVYEAVKLTNDP